MENTINYIKSNVYAEKKKLLFPANLRRIFFPFFHTLTYMFYNIYLELNKHHFFTQNTYV